MTSNTFNFSASFASGGERGTSKRQEKRSGEGPGPGTYAVANRARKPDLREMRPELQYFGSTAERFKAAREENSLGPGTYAQIKRRPEPPNARGFCSTMDRFKEGDHKSEIAPGPGQYQLPGISDEAMNGPLATFSMLGNSGGLAFGAMNKRFTYPNEANAPPGPGYYVVPGMSDDAAGDIAPEEFDSRGRAKKKPFKASRLPGAAFASRTPKDSTSMSLVREGQQKPPPGAYDPVLVKDQATVVRLRSKSEGFLAGADRFFGGPLSAPKGQHGGLLYSPQYITGGKRDGTFNRSICEGMPDSGRPKGLGFDTQDKRFRHTAPSGKSPGPGSYKTDPSWITKSHNCYFGDLV